jgi:hypothetical protein
MTALMLVSGMVSSSARALALGDAAALSSVGQPLRVAIALTPTAGDSFAADCFTLAEPPGTGLPAIVTAKVSLERGAAGPRLIVTTTQVINEPALRLAVESRCGTPSRRDYVLLLDLSSAAAAPVTTAHLTPTHTPAAAVAIAPIARESGQERLAANIPSRDQVNMKAAAARRDPPASSGTGVDRLVQRPVGVGGSVAPAVLRYASTESNQVSGSFRPVAATSEVVRVPTSPSRVEPMLIDRSRDTWWTIAVAIAGFGVIVLGAILVRHGRAAPRARSASHDGTRASTPTGPRSNTNLSAAPVMLSHTNVPTDALLTRAAPTTRAWVSPATAVTLPNLASAGKSASQAADGSANGGDFDQTLDNLLGEIESDLNVETAIRRVHAAARSSLEKDVGCDAILRAIEAAERDLLMTPPPPSDAAMGSALESELLVTPKRPDKAAA